MSAWLWKLNKHCACKKKYAWDCSICTLECDEDSDVTEQLKTYIWVKSLIDDLIITCDKIVSYLWTKLINSMK